MKSPKVTVLMSVYNGEKYLREAMDSILNQTFKDFELIIINDASTDRTAEILQSYHDPRIRIINNEKNIGLTKSLNKGLKIARGEYIARMDADDISDNIRFEVQVKFLNVHPSIGVLGINSWIIDEEGNTIEQLNNPTSHNNIMASMLLENQFIHSSVMLRKFLFDRFGYYDENIELAQDYDLFLKLSLVTRLANLPAPLHKWRNNSTTGISVIKRSEQIVIRDRIRKDFLDKHYILNKDYINFVFSNFQFNPKDRILSVYLMRIIRDIPFFSDLFVIQTRLTYKYYLLKYTSHLRTIYRLKKEKIKRSIYLSEQKGIFKKLFEKIKKHIIENGTQKNISLSEKEMDNNKLICESRPSSLHLLSQYQCNNSCEFCGFDYRTKPLKAQLTLHNFETIFNNLKPSNISNIVFSGQGEPLMCKDIWKIAKFIKDKKIFLSINTNGELITGKNLSLLVKYFDSIIISLHSIRNDVHLQMCGKDNLEKVLNNIYALRKAKNDMPIVLYFAYSMRNIQEINDHLFLCAEIGNCSFIGAYVKFYDHKRRFSDLQNQKAYTFLSKDLSLYHHQEHADKLIENAMQYRKSLNIKEACFPPLFKNRFKYRKNCTFPYQSILVNVDGTVFPCGGSDIWMYDDILMKKLSFGNLLTNTIDEIWNNKDYQNLRYSSNGNCNNRINPRCNNCSTLGFLVDSGNIKDSHFITV